MFFKSGVVLREAYEVIFFEATWMKVKEICLKALIPRLSVNHIAEK